MELFPTGFRAAAALVLCCLSLSWAPAAITVDGSLDLDYGSPLAVQSVETQFGDATDPAGMGGGGELDAAYARVESGRLYVLLTGNTEPNFNAVSVFIDSKPGGENVLSNGPAYALNSVSQNFGGLTFDTGFEADYHVFGRWGGGAFQVDIVDRAGGMCTNDCGGDTGAANIGAGLGIQSGSVFGDGVGTTSYLGSAVDFGFNNTNIAGVIGGTGAANQAAAAAVTTGFEFSVALSDLGSPGFGDTIGIHAVYGNGDNNFHSNQTLGGLPAGTGNLGGDGAGGFTGNLSQVNFNNFAGAQYFRIQVPEPGSGMLLCLAGLAGLATRRRS